MEKRHQVFVSSTYEDLQKERQAVIQSLLEFDCIPVGMEFFPAADEAAWEVIKRVIEDCDYYVVIVAGRYGSLSPEGISYTQKEYEYAVEKGVPVIAFLHGAPGKIAAEKTEGNEESKKKLEQFRRLCKQRLCKYWQTPDELGGAVVKSLNQLKKTQPRIGWVRTDQVPDESASKEILRLKSRIEELEREREELRTSAPIGTETLQQGDDKFDMVFHIEVGDAMESGWVITEKMDVRITRTWNAIFNVLAPAMIREATENRLMGLIERNATVEELENAMESPYDGIPRIEDWDISTDSLHTIIVQLRSLGLIVPSVKARSLKDTSTYWKLTPYGDNIMTRMRALKREDDEPE